MTRTLGAIPSRPKPSDWRMPAILTPPTLEVTRKFWQRPVMLDQGPYGSCVPNAWTHFLTDAPVYHDDIPLLDPDNQPSYNTLGSSAYWVDPVTGDYDGEPRAAEKYAVNMYDRIHDGVMEPLDPTRKSGCYVDHGAIILKNRGLISAYYRATSADDVIQALLTHGPVVFASAWYTSMDDTRKDAKGRHWVDVDPATPIRGYHAYLLDGVDLAPDSGPACVRAHNSWGITWGRRGVALMSIEDLHTAYIQNAWVATEVAQ